MMAKINEAEEEEEEEPEEQNQQQQQQKNYHHNRMNIQQKRPGPEQNFSENSQSKKQTTTIKITRKTTKKTTMDFDHRITLGQVDGAEKIMQTKSNQISLPNITMDGNQTEEGEEEEEEGIMKKIEAFESYNNNNNDNNDNGDGRNFHANDYAVNNNNHHANADDRVEDHHSPNEILHDYPHFSNIEFGSAIVGMNRTNIGNNEKKDPEQKKQIETKRSKNNSGSNGKGVIAEQNANDVGIIYADHHNHDDCEQKPTTATATNSKIIVKEEEGSSHQQPKDPLMQGRRSQVDRFNGNVLESLANETSGNKFTPIYDAPMDRDHRNGTIISQSSSPWLRKDLSAESDQNQQQKQHHQYYDQRTIPSDALMQSDQSKVDINSNLHKTVDKLRAEIANLRTDNVRLQNWNGSLQEKIFKMFQEDHAIKASILDYGGGRLGQSLINISAAKSYGSLDGARDNLRKHIQHYSMDADSMEHSDLNISAASAVASRRSDRFNFRKRNSFLSETVSKNLLEQISLKQRNRILGSRIIMEHNDQCFDDTIDMRQDSKILGWKNNTERELFLNQNRKQNQRQPLGLSNCFGPSHKREQQKNGSCSPSLSFTVANNKDAHSDDMNRDQNRYEYRDPPSPQLNSMNLHQKRKLLRSNHLQRLQISMSIDQQQQQQQLPLQFETESRQNPFNNRTNNHLNDDEANNHNYSVDGQIGNYSINNIINATKNTNKVVGDYSGTEMVVLRKPRLASPSGNIPRIGAKTSNGSLYHSDDCIRMDDDNRKNQQLQIISNQLSVDVDKKNYIVRTNFLGGTKIYKRSRQTFKMILIGDSTVGKTSLIHRIRTGQFCSDQFPTIGIDFQTIQVRLDGEYYDIQLWDTAGQERYHSITKNYFRRVDAICMVYDVSKEQTFLNVRHWLQSIRDTLFDSIPFLLVANKIDLRQHPGYEGYLVPPEQGYRLAAEIGNCGFIETSCLNGTNVDQAILLATKMVLIHQHHQPLQKPSNGADSIRMKTIPHQNRGGCC